MDSFVRGYVVGPTELKDRVATGNTLQALFNACAIPAERLGEGAFFSVPDRRIRRRLKKFFKALEKLANANR